MPKDGYKWTWEQRARLSATMRLKHGAITEEEYYEELARINGTPIQESDKNECNKDEYIVAFRTWYLRESKNGISLAGSGPTFWKPYEALEAECYQVAPASLMKSFDYHSTLYDFSRCSCGLYGLKEQNGPARYGISGKVALWGNYLEATKGYRAQYGYPLSLDSVRCSDCDLTITSGIVYPGPAEWIKLLCDECGKRAQSSLFSNLVFPRIETLLSELRRIYGLETQETVRNPFETFINNELTEEI